MLRLAGGQVESLWDEVLPGEVRALPEDLEALDVLLRDDGLLEPIAASWQQEAVAHGRWTISMQTYVRLMVIKHRTGARFEPERTLIAGRQQPGSRRTQRRLARYRTGSEGRSATSNEATGSDAPGLKDHHGMETWTGWSILTYNLDTLAIRTS